MAAVFSPSTALPSSSSSFLESCLNFLSIHFTPVIVIGLLSFLSSFYLGLLTFGDAITFYLMLNVLKTFAPSLVDFSQIVSPVQPISPGESQESLQSRQEAEEFKFIVLLLSIRGLFNSVAMVRLAWKEARWDFLKWCAPVLTVSTCAGVFVLDHFGESSWLHPLLGVMLGGSGFSCLFLRIRKQYCPEEEKYVADNNKTKPQEESNKNDEFLPQNLNSEMNLMEKDHQQQKENVNFESTQQEQEQEEAEEMQRQNQSSTAFTTSFASRSYTKQQNYSSANTIVLPQETPNSPLSSPVVFSPSSTKENNEGVVSPLPSPTSNSTTNHKKNTNSTISTSQGLFPSTFEKSPVLNSFFEESYHQQQPQKSLRRSLTPNATVATQQTPPSSSLTMKFSSPKLKQQQQQQFNSSNLTTSRRKTSARLSAAPAPSSTSSVPQIPPPLLNNTNNEEDQLFALPPPEININDQSNDENDKNHIIIPDTPPTAGSASAVGQVAMFPSTPSILPDSMMIGNTNGSKKNTPFISASTPKKNNENNQIVQEETVCNEEHSTTEELETSTPGTNEQPQIQNESAAVSSSSTTDEDAEARRKLNDPVYMYKAKCFIVASCIASGFVGGICDVAAIGLIVVVTALELPKSLARGILPLCFLWILIIRFMYTVLEGEFTMAAAWPENISMIGFGIAGTAAGNYVGKVVNNEQFLMSVVVMMIVGGLSLGEAPFWMVGSAFGIGTIWVGRTFFESKKQRGFISNSLSTIAHLGKKEERRKE